jgi:hypothetical protein
MLRKVRLDATEVLHHVVIRGMAGIFSGELRLKGNMRSSFI